MVGLVVSDTFLLTGSWDKNSIQSTATGITKIEYAESIRNILHHEGGLNAILASALRQATNVNPFSGQEVVIGIPDDFVEHSILELDQDLSYDEHMEYIIWSESQKNRPQNQSVYIFCQVYCPSQENIHICTVPRSLVRTLKLSIAEMGGYPSWMGPASTLYLDGSGVSESALIHRRGNKYSFMKIQNNRFGMGSVVFSGGVARVISTTDVSEEITLDALGLEKSSGEYIPIFCPQKLGRQAKTAWELSDFRGSLPFDGINLEKNTIKLPYYEANILTQLIKNKTLEFSFNFFQNESITEFFFEEILGDPGESDSGGIEDIEENLADLDEIITNEVENIEENSINDLPSSIKKNASTNFSGFAIALLFIVGSFIALNYLKLQDQLNNNFFGIGDKFNIERSGIDDSTEIEIINKEPPIDLVKESRAISSSILKLLTQTDLNRYNGLTITKSFLSLEYLSGTNPNIENILELEPTSFSVEATGKDSTIFLWYYSFELQILDEIPPNGELNKIDLMVQLDTALTDYNLKYYEQVYTRNQIYGPMLVWVKGKADILQASAIISNLNNSILLRKFVLFNKSDQPSPRAGFYVSILED